MKHFRAAASDTLKFEFRSAFARRDRTTLDSSLSDTVDQDPAK